MRRASMPTAWPTDFAYVCPTAPISACQEHQARCLFLAVAGPEASLSCFRRCLQCVTWWSASQTHCRQGVHQAFSRLHERICAELRRLDLSDHYP